MRKLTLDLDAIQVESFTTHAAGAARGTVAGQQDGRDTYTCPAPTQDTCYGTCGCGDPSVDITCSTCMHTCDGTCWDPTCETCMVTCNHATGPERCCA